MKSLRILALTAALLSTSAWAFAEDHRGWGYQDRDDRAAYRTGFEQGRHDAESRRRFHPDENRYREGDDRRAYRQGYEAGFNSIRERHDDDRDRDRDRGRDGDDRWRNGGSYGGYGNGMQVAQQNGFRDGMNDGRKDRSTGHSFRPTQDDNYKNAPGYTSSMGDRQQYKNIYREGYEQGYQQGYNGRR